MHARFTTLLTFIYTFFLFFVFFSCCCSLHLSCHFFLSCRLLLRSTFTPFFWFFYPHGCAILINYLFCIAVCLYSALLYPNRSRTYLFYKLHTVINDDNSFSPFHHFLNTFCRFLSKFQVSC